ncbi:MAG: hypothetical protein M3R38_12355 [Actinomycetota bacterium]|nr:hypothetical protein [Actinomycetota bacterium]
MIREHSSDPAERTRDPKEHDPRAASPNPSTPRRAEALASVYAYVLDLDGERSRERDVRQAF